MGFLETFLVLVAGIACVKQSRISFIRNFLIIESLKFVATTFTAKLDLKILYSNFEFTANMGASDVTLRGSYLSNAKCEQTPLQLSATIIS